MSTTFWQGFFSEVLTFLTSILVLFGDFGKKSRNPRWWIQDGQRLRTRRHMTLKNHFAHFQKENNFWALPSPFPSSETQGQLVGTTGFSWAKVYNKSGRARGHLLLPNEFQKRLKSRLLIGRKVFFWPIRRRDFKRFWNSFGKSKCPGALPLLL